MCLSKSREAFTVSILLISTACSEVSPCYDDRGNAISCREEVDMSTDQDMSADMKLARDQGDEQEEACIPRTMEAVCASTCGVVSDGCDGMVQCEPCACEGGVPAQPVCGACGLGRSVCDEHQEVTCVYPGDIPVDTFSCDQIVYVDPKEPMGGGTKEMPFNSYAAALQSFAADETGVIVMSEGVLNEPLVLKSGVHVMAGYQNDSTGWVRDDQAQVVFKPASSPDENEDTFGMIATELMRPTIVYGVQIEAPDAPPEKTSYGAYIKDATFLTLDHVLIKAGRGGAGRPGQDGADGADGGSGGEPECVIDIQKYQTDSAYPTGGTAGRNPSCPMADGGVGGFGAINTQAGPQAPKPGRESVNGLAKGGDGGEIGPQGIQDEYLGHDGENGPLVSADIDRDGEGGKAMSVIRDDRWISMGDGRPGTSGQDGSGGGGGGGAGDSAQFPWSMGGAGGGAGGCGGSFGTGGTGGGASIGVMAVRSTVSLVSSNIDARIGGSGGRGGQGGPGGAGGEGGRGTFDSCGYGTKAWRSGHGGKGSDGEDGGGGGGGAGGASIGALCQDGFLIFNSDSEVAAAAAAAGGGGNSQGEDGVVEDVLGCN